MGDDINETKSIDVVFLTAVMMLEDGYRNCEGTETATHKLAGLHANLIASLAARFTGYDRALLLQDVQKTISQQLNKIDARNAPPEGANQVF